MEAGPKSRIPPPLPIVCVSGAPPDRPAFAKLKEEMNSSTSHHRWLEYRNERTSSSSSDSGVALQFSPPTHLHSHSVSSISSVLALSPPGLSPLTVHDSAFSTPTAQQGNRFTFDHVPFRRQAHSDGATTSSIVEETTSDMVSSAFDIPSSSSRKSHDTLNSVLTQVRQKDNMNGHQVLQRKQSVIQTTIRNETTTSATSESVSPSLILPLSVSVGTTESSNMERVINGSQMLLGTIYPSTRHNLLSPSLSSPLSSSSDSFRLNLSPNQLQSSPHSDKSPLSVSSEVLDDDDKKQYYCHICKKDFKRPDILSRHLRRHTGEKPFGCNSCGRFFSRSDHLRTHRRTHTDEKPYQCSICPYAARRRDVLTRHMSTRHQAKAGASVFQKHRDIRRCLSDGDQALCSPHKSSADVIRRPRHQTEASTNPPTENNSRDRTLTEANVVRDRVEEEDATQEFPSLLEIEDDVIVDVCDEDGEDDEQ